MDKKTIKVLVVDDSRVARELLGHIIQSDPLLQIAGFVQNGDEALHWLQNNECDVITMDIQMPILNGFEVTQRIMEVKPKPIVIISSCYTAADKKMSFKALEAGALAILEKPSNYKDAKYQEQTKEVLDTIKTIAGIRVVKRPAKSFTEISLDSEKKKQHKVKAVAIGASLGGPIAICEILSALSDKFPVPIFIVQHIAAGFTDGFVRWLQEHSRLRICLAEHQGKALPGCVYVGADSLQMEVKKGNLISLADPLQNKLQPSVGCLFKSMADTYGSECIGVILTGMGRDGAKELLLMKQKGAYTIAQDEESCLMFGMPKEAILLGAAEQVLPLQKIADTLNTLVMGN